MGNSFVFPAVLKTVGGGKELFLPQFSEAIEIMPEDTIEKIVEIAKAFIKSKLTELMEERKAMPKSIDISTLSLAKGEYLLFVEMNKLKRPCTVADRIRYMRQISGL